MNRQGSIMMAAALLLGAVVATALPGVSIRLAAASADLGAGRGLVTAVDAGTNTLVLETDSGVQRVHVAPVATIRDDHDEALALSDIRSGDAVAYEVQDGAATVVHVARGFWAIPSEG
jgi:hypothetical protein